MKRFVCALACALGAVSPLSAQTVPDKKLPRTGSLSSSFVTGRSVTTAPEPFGFDELNRYEESPITGSVSRVRPGQWQLKVFNNSEKDTYAVDVEVFQLNDGLAVVKRDFFSYTIPAKGSKTQDIAEASGVKGAEMNLTRWRNLTSKKKVGTAPSQQSAKK
jgi:hypothetical protein